MGNDCIPEKKRETSGMTEEEVNHEINQLELDIHLLQRTVEEKDEIIKELEGKLKKTTAKEEEEEESEGESEGEIEWESESEGEKLTTEEIERPSVKYVEKADEIESLKNRVNILRIKIGENEEECETKTKKLEEKLRVHICQLEKNHQESIEVMKIERKHEILRMIQEIEIMIKNHNSEIENIRNEHDQEISHMLEINENSINELSNKHEKKVEILANTIVGLEEKLENIKVVSEFTQKRSNVFKEFYQSEKTYLLGIQFLKNDYLDELKGSQLQLMKESDFKKITIFQDFEVILQLNISFMSGLEKNLFTVQGDLKIVEIVIKYSDLFKMYVAYIQHYQKSNSILREIIGQSKKLEKFLKTKKVELKDRLKKGLGRKGSTLFDVSIDGLLLSIIQRPPRYLMLVKDLLKSTNEKLEPEMYGRLKTSVETLENLVSYCNSSSKSYQNKMIIAQLSLDLGLFDGNLNNKELIYENKYVEYTPAEGREKIQVVMRLINNLLVMTERLLPGMKSNRFDQNSKRNKGSTMMKSLLSKKRKEKTKKWFVSFVIDEYSRLEDADNGEKSVFVFSQSENEIIKFGLKFSSVGKKNDFKKAIRKVSDSYVRIIDEL